MLQIQRKKIYRNNRQEIMKQIQEREIDMKKD